MSLPIEESEYRRVSETFVKWFEGISFNYNVRFYPSVLHMDIYLKKEYLICNNNKRHECITIQKVVVQEKWRRRGLFKTMLQIIETLASKEGWFVNVDSVRNKDLHKYLTSIGYQNVADSDDCLWYQPKGFRDLFHPRRFEENFFLLE